ncbi:spermidine/putrescine ABC transporter substrate-binding protein [Halorussus limi]|uniref:Spermidine/putrescine ABC transporter substrate-binding protein n=1 Tax=Halorussus limi TaxID=2938695 RepID=A0A8U0HWB2_9EURY|nr:spermidine/putrescine ABC transporter substrate-binding protein [Halorussus limi]UPV75405.1 spermidine/putrescine ABC transporter substrate-binding protein [Halorussus limi]
MVKQRKTDGDRRRFLKTTGSLTAIGLTGLAGCTGGDGGGQATTTTASDTTTAASKNPREKYGLKELDYELEDKLNIFQWGDYWPDGTVQDFEKTYGVKVNVSNYASNEEMFNKLKAGGLKQYDLVFPSDYMINVLVDQGMLQKLDKSKIPNYGNLGSKFTDTPYDPDPGTYSAPYQWGTSGIGYNKEMLGSDVSINSWDAMWNEQWKGQMTMLDDMRETIGATLKRLGYSLNTKDESKIEEAKEMLINQKSLLKTYDSSNFTTNLINKQASPVHAWSGGVFQAYWETYKDGSSPIAYAVPKEGGVIWVDNGAVTKKAPHPNAAHAFINYYLNAKIGARITNWTYYGSPNEQAEKHISEDILNNKSIYPDSSTMKKLEYIQNLGQATQTYSRAWTEIQNA